MGQKLSQDLLINKVSKEEDGDSRPYSINKSKKLSLCDSIYYDLKIRLSTVLIIAVILGLILPFALLELIQMLLGPQQFTCTILTKDRVPCVLAGVNASVLNREQCENVGCCWNSAVDAIYGNKQPSCYHTRPSRYDYTVTSSFISVINGTSQTTLYMMPRKDLQEKPFGSSMLDVKLTINAVTENYLRIQIVPKDIESNQSVFPDPQYGNVSKMSYVVAHAVSGDRFALKVFRSGDGQTAILSMDEGPLMMTDNYMEFTLRTPTTNVYGLGQGSHSTLKHSMTWDSLHLFDRSGLYSKNLNGTLAYGAHPVYICLEDNGHAHGVLLGLSQLTDVSLQMQPSISFRTSGNLIELHLFMGPTPKDVIRQISEVVGKPAMPPFWALGYHTCRSYGNTTIAAKVIKELKELGIPHESDCGDSQLLRWLGVNTESLDDLATISQQLADTGRKLVLHQGPQIVNDSSTPTFNAYKMGLLRNVFIKGFMTDKPYFGKLDDKFVVYPDSTAENFSNWMEAVYSDFYGMLRSNGIDVQGMFLVDNTPLDETNRTISPCSTTELPPVAEYLMNYYNDADDTICLNSMHADNIPHYTYHNTYGNIHLKSISETLKNSSNRLFLSSLSTFGGSGQYGGHWGGEYSTNWNTMKNSVVHLLEFNMFGVPLIGVPIIGYEGNFSYENSPELSWRWTQLGSLYPLAFTYYGSKEKPREANFFPKPFQTMTANVLKLRYSLLPYFYTQFYHAHIDGDPVLRPLFYEFPTDKTAIDIDEEFFWGPALLVTPMLYPYPNEIETYFPPGCWYEFQTYYEQCSTKGMFQTIVPSSSLPNMYLRGGTVIVQQSPGVTMADTRLGNFTITVALEGFNVSGVAASGDVVVDDGLTDNSPLFVTKFDVVGNTFSSVCNGECELDGKTLRTSTLVEKLVILGVLEEPNDIILNSVINVTSYMIYDDTVHSLKLVALDFFDLRYNITISWS